MTRKWQDFQNEPQELGSRSLWHQVKFHDKILPTCDNWWLRVARMSLAVALVGKDTIVLATDSRTTCGLDGEIRFSDSTTKCWQASKCTGIVCAGIAGYGEWLVELLKHEIEAKKVSIEQLDIIELVDIFSEHANRNFSRYANNSSLGAGVAKQYFTEFMVVGQFEKFLTFFELQLQ